MNKPKHFDDDTPYGFQLNCCPVQYLHPDSEAEVKALPPLALEERASSTRSTGLFRNRSRAASAHDGEQPDIDIDVRRSASSRAGEEGLEAGQVFDSGVSIQSSRSLSVNSTSVPLGYNQQQAHQSGGRKWKKGAAIALVCAFVGLCAVVIALSLSADSIVAAGMNRYGLLGDSDNDGIGDELEKQLGLDPFDWDTNGDGKSDREELELLVAERLAASASAPTCPKSPKAPSAPKSPKAPSAPKSPKAPSAPKSPKAPSAPKSPKAPSAPKSPKCTADPAL